MARSQKPRVLTRCTAEYYNRDNKDSRIVEFSFPDGEGGLMEFRTLPNGFNIIHIYRADSGIRVGLPEGSFIDDVDRDTNGLIYTLKGDK